MTAKGEKTSLEGNAKQYAMIRAKQEESNQELHEAIKYSNERRGELLVMMERKQKFDERGSAGHLVKDILGNQGLGAEVLWRRN